ncbi:hypothetical protein ACIPWF_04185 [Paenarthrobacter sp. NPDC089989]|uniref:hypothetical protein n=1 Tax=unclassified Paenarthrobacter TaxID=2634190 RepID=UPI0037F9CE21
MTTMIDLTHALIREMQTVTEAGGSTTTGYEQIRDRWTALLTQETTAATRLADSIISGEDGSALYSLALAEEVGPEIIGKVRLKVAEQIYPALRDEIVKVAAANYETLRSGFNKTAAQLVADMNAVDPDSRPEQLMTAPTKARQAWAEAPIHALELNGQIPALATAAKLAGLNLPGNDGHLPLTTDPGNKHRRRVWEAWETTDGRTGRWAALHKLGVTITAPPLDQYKPYRRPADLETRYKPGPMGGHSPYIYDPEDVAAA